MILKFKQVLYFAKYLVLLCLPLVFQDLYVYSHCAFTSVHLLRFVAFLYLMDTSCAGRSP